VRIVDDHVHVRGSSLMTGYVSSTSAFIEGGWFNTGDLGFLDGRGRLHVRGRRVDLIVTGGENVSPAEVEHEVERIPGVAAACVFGVDHERWGERIAVAIVAADPNRPPDSKVLSEHLTTHLAPHKRPRLVAFMDALPMTAAGKLDRRRMGSAAAPHLRPIIFSLANDK
jgi:o-succinylbenzoate---CoA ligase